MMTQELKLLCEKIDNSELIVEDYKVPGSLGSFVSISRYIFKVQYKSYLIEIQNELGNHNLGKVYLSLEQKYIPNFEISSIDHFFNLFLRKKNMLKISCKNSEFKEILIQFTIKSNLEKIAKENSFEPKIFSYQEKNIQLIKTDYSLQFENKIGAIEALIDFHKLIIDNV